MARIGLMYSDRERFKIHDCSPNILYAGNESNLSISADSVARLSNSTGVDRSFNVGLGGILGNFECQIIA